ncbi:hypothetical protein LOAG_07125 [Loa loa]|uniref:Uncharacterized protein n=1 Tax=Loa loa TaxID=7209 RepID=A0A1I7VF02_LOALO|nr:hypothetical protein LOAG_07125 [Loa loa]EFO21366.2 hypothetical protein LOAG_07125 [Loa loa]
MREESENEGSNLNILPGFHLKSLTFLSIGKERLYWNEMGELDLVLCTITTLLIWLFWQQLEKVKSEQERRKFTKVRNKKEAKISEKVTRERIVIEEREVNFKKVASLRTPLSLPTSLPPSQPSSVLATKTAIPTISTESAIDINLSSPSPLPSHPPSQQPSTISSAATAIPEKSTVSSDEAKQVRENFDKSNETGPEWGPFDKQQMPQQKPWVFEGEAYYPPNFYTIARQSRE